MRAGQRAEPLSGKFKDNFFFFLPENPICGFNLLILQVLEEKVTKCKTIIANIFVFFAKVKLSEKLQENVREGKTIAAKVFVFFSLQKLNGNLRQQTLILY